MNDLTEKTCKPCEGGVAPLSGEEIATFLKKIDSQWKRATDDKSITREFRFKNYYQTIAFVNSVAWIAHAQDHHPDLEVSYNRCVIVFSTHAIGGLSENDFICAAKIDALLD